MEEKKSFTKKPFAKKPYRVDAKALESKGFKVIRYDRHESYAKIYRINGRAFIGSVNPVTGDRTISKAGPFASVKDMEDLRVAWDQLSEDVLGPRPTVPNPQDIVIMGNYSADPSLLKGNTTIMTDQCMTEPTTDLFVDTAAFTYLTHNKA